ncbi:hypothetical protein MVEN_01820900 [Mycena venus]|uniref:Uncharacterized protein n=1 Tax=Mycena venus TaxID=2733690 RepID=A0A8H7CLQ7_9AGAR|nr:hypothetical protein MVEN_01820900 [Mycena venus]
MPQGVAPVGFQLRTGETLPIFPAGCTVDPGHNDTLAACCAAVGSTPTQEDGIFGCPYTAGFTPAANQTFGACALERGASSSCAPADRANAAAASAQPLGWNSVSWGMSCLLIGIVSSLLFS